MEEKTERKLHPIVEIAIISIIAYCINLFTGLPVSQLMIRFYLRSSTLILLIGIVRMAIALFAASFICFAMIEKRRFNKGKILAGSIIIAIALNLVINVINICLFRFLGVATLALSLKITTCATTLLAAILILLVNRTGDAKKEARINESKIKCDMVVHVLLLLFTFGIWQLIWVYRVTEYLNCVDDEEYRNPATKLLLFMFVPFYSLYWVYKSAQRIDKLAGLVGVVSDLAMVCLIVEIFVPIIPPILMQDKINKIIEKTDE